MARTKTGSSSEAVIGQATRVRGRVSGDGDVRLEGTIDGDIVLRGDLVIAEGGRATSTVDAHGVTIGGELEGDIRAAGVVHLTAGARVRGNIQGEAVAMDDGAEYSGRIMSEFELPAELGGASSGRRR